MTRKRAKKAEVIFKVEKVPRKLRAKLQVLFAVVVGFLSEFATVELHKGRALPLDVLELAGRIRLRQDRLPICLGQMVLRGACDGLGRRR